MLEVPVMLGDGIGPEIVSATRRVLEAACARSGARITFVECPCGAAAVKTHGTTIPDETLERLEQAPGWVLGPLTTHEYEGGATQPNVSALLRRRYQLFANVRPIRALVDPRARVFREPLDLVVVRENTEGFYADRNLHAGPGEFMPTADVALSVRVITRTASEAVADAAFRLAGERRKHVTVVHKGNVLRLTDGLFLESCRRVAADHSDIAVDTMHVDAAATAMITDPGAFDVIVTTNMFGDILSNEGAGLIGGLGVVPGLNRGRERAMAQASHGSAPSLAGTGTANPAAEILSGQMLLQWLGERLSDDKLQAAAQRVDRAVGEALRDGSADALTPDLGGTGSTETLTDAILAAL